MEKLRKTIISDKIHMVDSVHMRQRSYTLYHNELPSRQTSDTYILLYWFSIAKHENKNFKLRWQTKGFVYSSFNNISN